MSADSTYPLCISMTYRKKKKTQDIYFFPVQKRIHSNNNYLKLLITSVILTRNMCRILFFDEGMNAKIRVFLDCFLRTL